MPKSQKDKTRETAGTCNNQMNFFITFIAVFVAVSDAYTPIVLYHGLGDSCCSSK